MCKSCHSIYQIQNGDRINAHRRNNRSNTTAISDKKYRLTHQYRYKAASTLKSHRAKGYIINVTVSEIEQLFVNTTHCQICGIELKFNTTRPRSNSPTLDRIDNQNELSIDNVWIICHRCNVSKHNRTMRGLYNWCKEIVEKFKCDYNEE